MSECKTKPEEPEGKGEDPWRSAGEDPWTVVQGQFGSVLPLGPLGGVEPAPKKVSNATEVFNRFENLPVTEEDLEVEELRAEHERFLKERDDLNRGQMLDHLEEQYQLILEGKRPSQSRLTIGGKGKKWRFSKTLAQRDLEDREKYLQDCGVNVRSF